MRKWSWVRNLLVLVAFVAACANTVPVGDSTPADGAVSDMGVSDSPVVRPGCIPGATPVCACTDGRTGAQTCASDGTFGVCTCTGPAPVLDAGVTPLPDVPPADVFACAAGLTTCVNGATTYCANTQSEVGNCGMCGHACAAPVNATATCVMGACGFACLAGFADCDGIAANGCEVSLSNNVRNCGGCGNICSGTNGTPSCVAGACAIACVAGFANCDGNPANGCEMDLSQTSACGSCGRACATGQGCCAGGCVDITSDRTNCGACGHVCPGGQTCVLGACTGTCVAGTPFCGTRCADIQTDLMNCGRCGHACPTDGNANHTCSGGTCHFTCAAGFADCNGVADDGCETNLRFQGNNCGACGVVCGMRAHATLNACDFGSCRLSCAAGFGDCDGDNANGCEVDLNTSNANCGACARACAAGQSCSAGACVPNCTVGMTTCGTGRGTYCANTTSDPANCGTCGRVCATAPHMSNTCSASTCNPTCDVGFADCDGVAANGCEVSLSSNTNCGACGRACPTGGTCTSGTCSGGTMVCSGTTVMCGTVCVHTSTDPAHCGACGNACAMGQACIGGACATACSVGSTVCRTGCRDLRVDPAHCGACGNVCGPSQACVAGACVTACVTGATNCAGTCHDLMIDPANCGVCGRVCLAGQTCTAGACTPTSFDAGVDVVIADVADAAMDASDVLDVAIDSADVTDASDADVITDVTDSGDVFVADVGMGGCPRGFHPRSFAVRLPNTAAAACTVAYTVGATIYGQNFPEPVVTGPGVTVESSPRPPPGTPLSVYVGPFASTTPLPSTILVDTRAWGDFPYVDFSGRCSNGVYLEDIGTFWASHDFVGGGGSATEDDVERGPTVVRIGRLLRIYLGPACVPDR